MAKKPEPLLPIGDRLRQRRVEVLHKGLREIAKLLGVTPAHMTDLEKNRRTPSEELLLRICRIYDMPEPELRAGWSRPEIIVKEVASQDAVTAELEFLRTARKLTSDQWDNLIAQAQRMASQDRKVR